MLRPESVFRNALIIDFETDGLPRSGGDGTIIHPGPLEAFAYYSPYLAEEALMGHFSWPWTSGMLRRCDPTAYAMHEKSGLLGEMVIGEDQDRHVSTQFLRTQLESWLESVPPSEEDGNFPKFVVTGFSPHFDRDILVSLGMGDLVSHRVLDLSMLARLFEIHKPGAGEAAHRARPDCLAALAVARDMWQIMSFASESAHALAELVGEGPEAVAEAVHDKWQATLGDHPGPGDEPPPELVDSLRDEMAARATEAAESATQEALAEMNQDSMTDEAVAAPESSEAPDSVPNRAESGED